VVIDREEIRKRKKAPSRKFRDEFGHTPLSIEERYPGFRRRGTVFYTRGYCVENRLSTQLSRSAEIYEGDVSVLDSRSATRSNASAQVPRTSFVAAPSRSGC
jgi:hypothetical protein